MYMIWLIVNDNVTQVKNFPTSIEVVNLVTITIGGRNVSPCDPCLMFIHLTNNIWKKSKYLKQ